MARTPRLTRALVDKLPATIPDPGPIAEIANLQTPAATRARLEAAMASRPEGPLWIFAFGSLIWNPGFAVAERRVAHVRGWQRSFCIGGDTRYRGNPDNPGLMLSLAPGGACDGVALQMDEGEIPEALMALFMREPPAPPVWVVAESEAGPITALCFVAPPEEVAKTAGLTLADIARQIAPAVGMFGNMPDYVLNTVEQMEAAGLQCPMLWELQALLADELARLDQASRFGDGDGFQAGAWHSGGDISGRDQMELGAFSVSLAVKDIAASKAFYEHFGFSVFHGDQSQGWLILTNGSTKIGLFQGMFERNILTFNPGWDQNAQPLAEFTDVREIQKKLKAAGITLTTEADESTTGPASLACLDPDGNPVLVDQHV